MQVTADATTFSRSHEKSSSSGKKQLRFVSKMREMAANLSLANSVASKGLWLHQNGYYEDAAHYIRLAMSHEPDDPRLWLQLYDNEVALGHPVEAIRALHRAGELSPAIRDNIDEVQKGLLSQLSSNRERQMVVKELLEGDDIVEVVAAPQGGADVSADVSHRVLWSTHLGFSNLTTREEVGFNAALARLARDGFRDFLEERGGSTVGDNNDNFYEWQSQLLTPPDQTRVTSSPAFRAGTGWRALQRSPEFRRLKQHVEAAFRGYLVHMGGNAAQPLKGRVYAWANVHGEGQGHKPHVHGDSVLSAVYYAKLPPGAGRIVFYDPRGVSSFDHARDLFGGDDAKPAALPPFTRPFVFNPKPGDLVVFPSWLVHGVEATQSTEERVSFSFNLIGDWSTFDDNA